MHRSVIALLAICIVACSSQPKKKPLVVYSPHGKDLLGEFARRYETSHPGVEVQWLDLGSQDIVDRVRTERFNPQADIWWGAPSLMFSRAEAESLLEKYVPTWAGSVPADFKSAGGFWTGTFITPAVIMYNTRLITRAEAPADWDDLLDPRWKDKVIIRYPLASGTMRMLFCALIQREIDRTGDSTAGFRWLQRLDRNTKTYAADPTQLYLKVAREEGAVSVWDLPDIVIQVQVHGYPFGYVVPRSGTPLVTDCIAIIRGTKNRQEAERFYEFVTSREAMIDQARQFFRIPTRSDISAADLPAWMDSLQLRPMNVDWQRIAGREQSWMNAWEEHVRGTGSLLP